MEIARIPCFICYTMFEGETGLEVLAKVHEHIDTVHASNQQGRGEPI